MEFTQQLSHGCCVHLHCLGRPTCRGRAASMHAVMPPRLRACDTSVDSGWEDWVGWGLYADEGRRQDALWLCGRSTAALRLRQRTMVACGESWRDVARSSAGDGDWRRSVGRWLTCLRSPTSTRRTFATRTVTKLAVVSAALPRVRLVIRPIHIHRQRLTSFPDPEPFAVNICEVEPQAEEIISYRMPAFRKAACSSDFAAFKEHIGLYPPVRGNSSLEKKTAPYAGARKGSAVPAGSPDSLRPDREHRGVPCPRERRENRNQESRAL